MDTITCKTCNDTGFDLAFDSPCGDCGAYQAQMSDERIEEARTEAKAASARIEEAAADAVELVAWLEAQTWSDFAQSLAKSYRSKGVLTEKQMASALRMRTKVQARERSTSPATVEFRWTKDGDTWAIKGPAGYAGTEVTVTKASGETAQVHLGQETGKLADLVIYATAKKGGKAKQAERPDGFYYLPAQDGDELRVFKLQHAVHGSGNQYAKELLAGTFEYQGRGPLSLDLQPMTMEVAQQYGRLYGVCCRCGRTLTDEGSIEAGIGPVCAGKGF